LHLSQGTIKDIEAATTSRSSIDIYQGRLGSCWCIIYGWCYHFMRSYSFKPQESIIVAHFYGGIARRLTTDNRQDQSEGESVGDVEVAAVAGVEGVVVAKVAAIAQEKRIGVAAVAGVVEEVVAAKVAAAAQEKRIGVAAKVAAAVQEKRIGVAAKVAAQAQEKRIGVAAKVAAQAQEERIRVAAVAEVVEEVVVAKVAAAAQEKRIGVAAQQKRMAEKRVQSQPRKYRNGHQRDYKRLYRKQACGG
jgi:hypothetical protein